MEVWDRAPVPKALAKGTSGFECGKPDEGNVCNENHCCGLATKDGGKGKWICHIDTERTYTGPDKIEMIFECSAQRLLAFASALLAFISLI